MTFVMIIYDLKVIETTTTSNVSEYTGAPEVAYNYNTELHNKIRSAMHAKGYTSTAHTTKTHLPHNCLVKDNTNQQQAITDLIDVAKKNNVALESFVAVTVTGSYQADASLL